MNLRFHLLTILSLLVSPLLPAEELCELPFNNREVETLSRDSINAADSALRIRCESLYELTCSPGELPDGTGVTLSRAHVEEKKASVVRKTVAKARPEFRSALLDPSKNDFRRKLLAVTPSARSVCPDVARPLSGACLEALTNSASSFFSTSKGNGISESSSVSPERALILDETFRGIAESSIRSMRAELSEGIEAPVREMFPDIQNRLIRKIERDVTDPALRRSMIDRIQRIQFGGTDDPKAPRDSIESLTDEGGRYDFTASPPKFFYRLGSLLRSTSRFQMAYIIAHELSHSIDPCKISREPTAIVNYQRGSMEDLLRQHPYGPALSCLSGSDSADAPLKPQLGHSGETPTSFDTVCGISNRLDESFSDWMGMEIVPEYLRSRFPDLTPGQFTKGYSNIWRGSCEDNTAELIDRYPDQARRVNAIIGAQPLAREQMNCRPSEKPQFRHCEGR